MSRSRILAGIAVAVALVAIGLAAPIWARVHHGPGACPTYRIDARHRAALVTGSGAPVLVIGDSYSTGWKVRQDQSWPIRLPGRVRVDGFPGSGFSRDASPCGDVSYAARAPHSLTPDVHTVVVEGGLNDYDQPESDIEAGFRRLMGELVGRRVVVVGPPPAPSRAAAVARVDVLLARLCREAAVRYVSTIDLRLPYLSDRLHLTPHGHREFGDRVAAAVGALA